MSERNWEIAASAALDGEIESGELVTLLDDMAADPGCREYWRRMRAVETRLEPMVRPAPAPLGAGRSRRPALFWIAPAMAAALALLLFLPTRGERPASLPAADGSQVSVRLAEAEGEMTDARFVELVLEILRADQRYRDKMAEILDEVRPDSRLDEAGSPEDDPRTGELLASRGEEHRDESAGELPYEALAGIH